METSPTPEELALEKVFQEMNEAGMAPEAYAELVFEGIREEKFYILTNQDWNWLIRQRMETILGGTNPEVSKIHG